MIPAGALERFTTQTSKTKTARLTFKYNGEQQGDVVNGRVSFLPTRVGSGETEQGGRLTSEVLAEISVDLGVVVKAHYRVFAEFPDGSTTQFHVRTEPVLSNDQTEFVFVVVHMDGE